MTPIEDQETNAIVSTLALMDAPVEGGSVLEA
jgi:hypothetical protein